MNFNREEKWQFIKKFVNFCKENDIWYSLDNYSLLGLKRHGGFVPWVEKFQVFINIESYQKLTKLFPKKIVDSSIDSKINSYKAFFVNESKDWEKKQEFVEIRILVPTSTKNISKFRRGELLRKSRDLKVAINKLYKEEYEGFYFLDTNKKTSKLWISNLSFKREWDNFGNVKVPFIKEWKEVLVNQFGINYMKAIIPSKYYFYEGPLQKELVKG